MYWRVASILGWLFDPEHPSAHLYPRWLFLRALGLIYVSAFYPLLFQIRGLIGPHGILPASEYLEQVAQQAGHARYWYAPTVLWFSSSNFMLMALCWVGVAASLFVVFNLLPRLALAVCFVCFLSFVSAAGEFSGYQSDGMLLEAGFLSLFLAPAGVRPGLGEAHPPSRASRWLLIWQCFRIYFESGVGKLASGDPEWRNFTAMDEYYQNGPLPTWVGWYAHQLPHWWHAFTAFGTLVLELGLVWMMFFPRRFRIACFFAVSLLQMGIVLTANYTFLNYLVFSLALLLLDDQFIERFVPLRWRKAPDTRAQQAPAGWGTIATGSVRQFLRAQAAGMRLSFKAVVLTWLAYASTVRLLWMFAPFPFPTAPVGALEPLRIADRYGLFAAMTRGRYEIEFQGSNDGQNWTAYRFRYKPQQPAEAPRIYAPYQPRFDWNLWFASLTSWRADPIAIRTEKALLTNNPDVLSLFAGNPFGKGPPKQIRAVLWQYWFTTRKERRGSGLWWRRQLLGLYAPALELSPEGNPKVLQLPTVFPSRE
jgi:lipase maturation factor 1